VSLALLVSFVLVVLLTFVSLALLEFAAAAMGNMDSTTCGIALLDVDVRSSLLISLVLVLLGLVTLFVLSHGR